MIAPLIPHPATPAEVPLSRFEACWLAEAVRLRELAEDAEIGIGIVGGSRSSELAEEALPIVGGEEAWLLRRAATIARDNGMLEATLAWRRRAALMLGLLCVLAVLSGFSAALGFFGAQERAVNVVWTLLGLIGMPVLALLFWIVSSLLTGRVGAGVPGELWMWLMSHAPRFGGGTNHAAEVAVVRALATLSSRSGLARWWLGFITHTLWLLMIAACLVTIVLALSVRSYSFVLETTILAPEDIAGLVENIAALPASLGFVVPDAEMVTAALAATQTDVSSAAAGADAAAGLSAIAPSAAPSADPSTNPAADLADDISAGLAGDLAAVSATQSEAARRAWASWLIGGLLVYALLPRVLVWMFAAVRLWQLRAGLALDIRLPGYTELLRRTASTDSPGVVDAAPALPLPPQVAAIHRVRNHDAVLLGLELGRDLLWPPARLAKPRSSAGGEFSVIEMVESREQRRSALAQLASHAPAKLLLACDVRLSPDRGTLGWIVEVSHYAGELRVWLVSPDSAEDVATAWNRELTWRDSLAAIGLGAERLITTESAAYAWLIQHD